MNSVNDPAPPARPDDRSQALTTGFFAAVPVPLVIVDAAGLIVASNRRAEQLWGMEAAEIQGAPAATVLGLAQVQDATVTALASWPAIQAALTSGARVECRIASRTGTTHIGAMVSVLWPYHQQSYTVLAFVQDRTATAFLGEPPAWATMDAVTGLGNRVQWDRLRAAWDQQPGVVVMLDLDDLKTVNDLYGHAAGDRVLALVGQVLQAQAGPHAMPLRYGGDEFVVVDGARTAAQATAWAQTVNAALAAAARAAAMPLVPHLSYGVTHYAPGQLAAAVREADDRMYEHKGTLLRSRGGGRLILSRARRMAIQTPESATDPGWGQGVGRFGPEFDAVLRAQYARLAEEARAFLAFVDPAPDTAVVEVGAGTGRLALEGGLATRVGPDGVLLLTDPAPAQLQQARQRVAQAGYAWLRFVEAPAEALPVASRCADLVVGAWFLHLCDAARAVQELARVTRAGGRIALDVPLAFTWPPAWVDILTPLWQALTAAGLPLRHMFHERGDIPDLCERQGLTVERTALWDLGAMPFPDAARAQQFFEEGGHLAVMAQELSKAARTAAMTAVYRRLAAVFAATAPEERVLTAQAEYVLARSD